MEWIIITSLPILVVFLIYKIKLLRDTITLKKIIIQRQQQETKQIINLHDQHDKLILKELQEVKPYLTPIKGYSEILLTQHWGKLEQRQEKRLEIIQSYSASLLLLIQKIEAKMIQ